MQTLRPEPHFVGKKVAPHQAIPSGFDLFGRALQGHVSCLKGVGGGFAMMVTAKPTVTEEEGVWVVRIENPSGKTQEYRCANERLAKQLASVLLPKDAR
jgi:hypothetical protein